MFFLKNMLFLSEKALFLPKESLILVKRCLFLPKDAVSYEILFRKAETSGCSMVCVTTGCPKVLVIFDTPLFLAICGNIVKPCGYSAEWQIFFVNNTRWYVA